MPKPIEGFSKLTKEEKIDWVTQNFAENPEWARSLLKRYWNPNQDVQQLHDEFIENTLSNYYLPFAIAPNFFINGNMQVIPMAIEESSVVAAASKSAKFWLERGGFKTKVISTEKVGQVHFFFQGETQKLQLFFDSIKPKLLAATKAITANMEKRGGGILDIELQNKTAKVPHYYQLHCTFETLDAMGANFINSCLEQFAATLQEEAANHDAFTPEEKNLNVVMSILSNYVPNCLVHAEVNCDVKALHKDPAKANQFAEKFVQAITIAKAEPFRAVTHNKGIMNGIDAVVLATGNDFRAVEAGIHAYAARKGTYSSLTHAEIKNGMFRFWIEIPLALGTVGGLTSLHPMVKLALELLGKPSARELMQVVAVAGLAQNFAAVRSLVTTGIQKGHMKMHLMNLLNQLKATEKEKETLVAEFKDKTVTNAAVKKFLEELRKT